MDDAAESLSGHRQKVRDARYLLDWALREMPMQYKKGDTEAPTVPKSVLEAVTAAEAELKALPPDGTGAPSPATVLALDEAVQKLSQTTAPVSVQTLRDTETPDDGISRVSLFYSRLIWTAGAVLVAVVLSEGMLSYAANFWPPFDDRDALNDILYAFVILAELMEPFTYGALGAVAYLLYSAKKFATNRSFDRYRGNEYRGRFVLGLVSGGAAALLVSTIELDDGSTLELSKAVVGFLGGYSTEFLAQLVNRLLEAILPRVNAASARAPRPSLLKGAPPPEPFSPSEAGALMKDLLDRLKTATDDDEKKKIMDLLDAMKARFGPPQ